MEECKYIDIIVRGEGEETTKELIENIEKEAPLNEVKGITFREKNEIIDTTLEYSEEDVEKVSSAIIKKVQEM